jgi:carboxyl-terminal processing protease
MNSKENKLKKAARTFLTSRILPPVLLLILIINLISGYKAYSKSLETKPLDDGYTSIAMFMNIVQLIREKYVDKEKVSYDELFTNALKGMLRGLDPFSSYLDKKSYLRMVKETEGREFGGLGIHVILKKHKLTVIVPMENSPAMKAGIKRGDVIIFINDKPTTPLSMSECMKLLQGAPGTEVTLTIHREAENLTKKFTIGRAIIEPHTVKWAFEEKDKIGYIRISQFNKPTATDIDEALLELKKLKMTALIIDLRNNPGGLLDSAVKVCSRFLETNELIVYIEGRKKSERQNFHSDTGAKVLEIPIAILVNDSSASAAEIVAGCLQDYKRAVLIGERTFGKGSVQSVIPMSNQSAVRLTTAKYYTPSERVIHGNGIEPDIIVDINPSTANTLYYQSLAYPGIVKPNVKGSIKDLQLERAIEILKGIRLFKKAEK